MTIERVPPPMMECGHAANATMSPDSRPVCAICVGLHPGAAVVVETPDLTGRTARCSYGNHGLKPSSPSLAFFEHNPDREHDTYYCGCWGWD